MDRQEPNLPILFMGIGTGLTVLLAFLGPFDTYSDFSFGRRLFSWGVIVALSMGGVYALRRFFAERIDHFVLRELVVFALFSPIVSAASWVLFLRDQETDSIWQNSPLFVVKVFAIAITVAFVRHSITAGLGLIHPWQKIDEQPRLFDRLTERGDADLIYLSSDDHYVIAGYSNGQSERVLIRMADAIAELDDYKGLRVHRSHWVNVAAIDGFGRKSGREYLVMTTGDLVPVSRSYRDSVLALSPQDVDITKERLDIAAQ
ncbi:hypothetical protein BVC71_11130 [Marivivens niveibacter]|uniref:HTH LytTR-type domain-containing protein n=1 Tax=Marivivens niveibacter TaxID=1930667 RepID=A0A251WZ80_9RHOB|nr:LytTR family DNA-binding domain-containing protein [Marivivens niveibacter]OUD09243.1 hypothetical protein BVC71_11130 [Marivivens niveibacter]